MRGRMRFWRSALVRALSDLCPARDVDRAVFQLLSVHSGGTILSLQMEGFSVIVPFCAPIQPRTEHQELCPADPYYVGGPLQGHNYVLCSRAHACLIPHKETNGHVVQNNL